MSGENRIGGKMTWNRLLSAIVAVSYVAAMGWYVGADTALKAVAGLLLPLACIWFGDELGNVTGVRFGVIGSFTTDATPGSIVRFGGWVVLILVVLVTLYVRFSLGK
jgi:hypothetical protein